MPRMPVTVMRWRCRRCLGQCTGTSSCGFLEIAGRALYCSLIAINWTLRVPKKPMTASRRRPQQSTRWRRSDAAAGWNFRPAAGRHEQSGDEADGACRRTHVAGPAQAGRLGRSIVGGSHCQDDRGRTARSGRRQPVRVSFSRRRGKSHPDACRPAFAAFSLCLQIVVVIDAPPAARNPRS